MSSYGSTQNYRRSASQSSGDHDAQDRRSVSSDAGTPRSHSRPGYSRQRSYPTPSPHRRVSHVSISSARDEADNHDVEQPGEETRFKAMPRDKRFIVITFSLVNFFLGVFYSLLGPFFPNEAKEKGVSTTTTGLIFGVFELILILMSPVFGNFITHIGAKFLYCTGIMVCGSSAVLFGFLDQSPDGTVYVVMCFVVRCVEGLGAAAFATASFAIMAHTFPKNVATMFGTLEMFTGLGLMAGPPIGGALYQVGGFRLPFIVTGSLLFSIGFISVFLLPSVQDLTKTEGSFILGLLRIPLVSIMGCYLMMGSAAIGFYDVGLSIYLKNIYHFSPVIMGLVFLAAPGVYAVTAPIWGFVSDRFPFLSWVILLVGYFIGGASFFFLGPAPFIPIRNDILWLLLVSLALGGFGISTLVISFQVITNATRDFGYPDSLETYGLISGLFNSFFSLGAFIGPLLGGNLIDRFEFPTASLFIGGGMILMAVVLLCYLGLVRLCCRNTTSTSETTPLSDETARLIDSGSDRQTGQTSTVLT